MYERDFIPWADPPPAALPPGYDLGAGLRGYELQLAARIHGNALAMLQERENPAEGITL